MLNIKKINTFLILFRYVLCLSLFHFSNFLLFHNFSTCTFQLLFVGYLYIYSLNLDRYLSFLSNQKYFQSILQRQYFSFSNNIHCNDGPLKMENLAIRIIVSIHSHSNLISASRMDDLHSRSRLHIKVCENKHHWTIMQTVYFELTSSACLLQARVD